MVRIAKYILSHNTYKEGGNHTHLVDEYEGETLCNHLHGKEGSIGDRVEYIDLLQPDPDKELCKLCKKKALKMFREEYSKIQK